MKPSIYADYNATTPLCQSAKAAMAMAFERWGNPSSAHREGRLARELLETSRESVASVLGCKPSELVFTSGGTESNASALLGFVSNHLRNIGTTSTAEKVRLLSAPTEHSSVLGSLQAIANHNAQVELRLLPFFSRSGSFDLEALESALREFRPHLLSLAIANNETGWLTPWDSIASLCRQYECVWHTDAVQALGKIPSQAWAQADLASFAAHKVYGPKGSGALLVRRNRALDSLLAGGSQETKRRAGTQNLIGIAGFAGAIQALPTSEVWQQLAACRDAFENKLCTELDGVTLLSAPQRLPNTSNFRIAGHANEVLLSALDLDGIAISAGSACSSGSISPSHVLTAVGMSEAEAKECLRVSWGIDSTPAHCDAVVEAIVFHVKRVRERRRPQ